MPSHQSISSRSRAGQVCVTVNYFLKQPGLARIVAPIDVLSTLLGALIHDLAHPGVNNTFLEATKNELAVTYNDVRTREPAREPARVRVHTGDAWLSPVRRPRISAEPLPNPWLAGGTPGAWLQTA